VTSKKTYGNGFDTALGRTDRARFKRWYDATSRVTRDRRA
jgi:hypothetical protein